MSGLKVPIVKVMSCVHTLLLRLKQGIPKKIFFAYFLFSCVFLSACSSAVIDVNSTPEGAEVSSLQGEVLGKTPLALTSEMSSKVVEDGIVNLRISARGYLPRLLVTDASTARRLNIVLPKSDTQSFKTEFARDFGKDMNSMLRDAFVIQKLVGAKKTDEAKVAIEKFKKEFGTLAFGYVMSAQVALGQGKKKEAKANLMQARALDPDDSDIAQMLKFFDGDKSSPSAKAAAEPVLTVPAAAPSALSAPPSALSAPATPKGTSQ